MFGPQLFGTPLVISTQIHDLGTDRLRLKHPLTVVFIPGPGMNLSVVWDEVGLYSEYRAENALTDESQEEEVVNAFETFKKKLVDLYDQVQKEENPNHLCQVRKRVFASMIEEVGHASL